MMSQATEMRFVCTLPLPATSGCNHLALNPVLRRRRRVCVPTPYPSHSRDHHTAAAAGASLDHDIW